MKVKRSKIVEIIQEEWNSIREEEKDQEEKKPKEKSQKDPTKEPSSKSPPKEKQDAPKGASKKNSPAPPEIPVDDQPADDDLEDEETGGDEEDAAEQKAKSKIADEIAGKTVQSITMEPKSKTIPGAQEIVLTFDQFPDPLKIIVTKSGKIAFYFRGLHNEL